LVGCDDIIDLGLEGGSAAGRVIANGTPEQVAAVHGSYSGQFLAGLLPKSRQRAASAS